MTTLPDREDRQSTSIDLTRRGRGRCRCRVALRPLVGSKNPYAALFGGALAESGMTTSHLGYGLGDYSWSADVILLHWPDEFFRHQGLKRTVKALILMALLTIGRLRGQKLVWLVHNVEPHDRSGRESKRMRSAFFRRLDGLVLLSRASRDLLLRHYPELAGLPWLVVAHGAYRPVSDRLPAPPPPIGERPVALAFIGRVERYKAPEVLARVVGNMPEGAAKLVVAGACRDPALETELRTLARPNIHLSLQYQDDATLESIVDEADAVVLPYRDIVNSGSALFALSRGRPVLAPRIGSLVELRDEVGEEWLWLYDGAFSAETLAAFLEWSRARTWAQLPDLSEQQWDRIGEKTADFLERICSSRSG